MQNDTISDDFSTTINNYQQMLIKENENLQNIMSFQESSLTTNRDYLCRISNLSKELIEIDEKRTNVMNQLLSLKSKLIMSASDSDDNVALIRNAVSDNEEPPISQTKQGEALLSTVEEIQKAVFGITEDCLKTNDLSVHQDVLNNLVLKIGSIVQNYVDDNDVVESKDDKIARQYLMIKSLQK